jgi:hypothetical protein
MPVVVFGPAARTEMIEASNWYAAHSLALASRFIAEVDATIARLGECDAAGLDGTPEECIPRNFLLRRRTSKR